MIFNHFQLFQPVMESHFDARSASFVMRQYSVCIDLLAFVTDICPDCSR